MNRPTLAHVARLAGVGPMTVSRTINGNSYVAEATARRVHAAIRKLHYVPNRAARILAGQRSKSIGLIVPDVSNRFYSVISQAVQQSAREAGYLVWLAASDNTPAVEKAQLEQMMSLPVDGILLVPAASRSSHLKAVATGSIPFVTVDLPIEVAPTDSVEVDSRAGSLIAIEHLIQHGYKRIACVAMNLHLASIRKRTAAYEDRLRKTRLPRQIVEVTSESSILTRLKALFQSSKPPDAIFTTDNICTTGTIQALHKMGLNIPGDVALLGFDDLDFYGLITPSVTTIRQPVEELGRTAARLLLDRMRGEMLAPCMRIVLPAALVIRESCGCSRRDE